MGFEGGNPLILRVSLARIVNLAGGSSLQVTEHEPRVAIEIANPDRSLSRLDQRELG